MKPVTIDYGPVRITAGKHKGKIGYYDNDGDRPGSAIVYIDCYPTFGDTDCEIPLKNLVQASEHEATEFRLKYMNAYELNRHDPKARLPVFIALNDHIEGSGLPPIVGTECVSGTPLLRSYFESSHGDQWVALVGPLGFVVHGGDIGWDKPIESKVGKDKPFKNYKDVAEQIRDICSGPTKGSRLFLGTIFNIPEATWLTAVFGAAAERFDDRG